MRRNYIIISIALLLSLFIYLFYRTEKTLVNELAIYLISFENYKSLRETITGFLPLNNIIIYSLPEGLWIFCTSLISKDFYVEVRKHRFSCSFVPILFCIVLEIFQLYHITNGRFDLLDILISLFFWLLALLSFKGKAEKKDILGPLNPKASFCFFTYGIVYLSHVIQ